MLSVNFTYAVCAGAASLGYTYGASEEEARAAYMSKPWSRGQQENELTLTRCDVITVDRGTSIEAMKTIAAERGMRVVCYYGLGALAFEDGVFYRSTKRTKPVMIGEAEVARLMRARGGLQEV